MFAVRLAGAAGESLPAEYIVADSLGIVQSLVLFLAAVFAAQAFLSSEKSGGLRDAAALAAAGYGFGLLSYVLRTKAAFAEPPSPGLRASLVLECASLAILIGAALIAATAFSRDDRRERGHRLGWAGVAFAGSSLLWLVSSLLESEVYSGEGALALTVGLDLESASIVAAIGAGTLAAAAFFSAGAADAPPERSIAARDLLLAAAAGVYGIFALGGFAGQAIAAIAYPNLDLATDWIVAIWLSALAEVPTVAAVVCLAAALQPPFLRALQRLRARAAS